MSSALELEVEVDPRPIPASLTTAEVADALAVSARRVKDLIRAGELVAFDASAPGAVIPSWRITPTALAAFIASRSTVKAAI